MTKLSNIPAKETTAKTAKTRKAKNGPAKLKWDPIEEVHQRIRSWMDNYQGKK